MSFCEHSAVEKDDSDLILGFVCLACVLAIWKFKTPSLNNVSVNNKVKLLMQSIKKTMKEMKNSEIHRKLSEFYVEINLFESPSLYEHSTR